MLLKKYQQQFAGGGVTATWAYLRQWATGALPPNPLVSHDTTPRHLRDPSFLKKALRSGTHSPRLFTLCWPCFYPQALDSSSPLPIGPQVRMPPASSLCVGQFLPASHRHSTPLRQLQLLCQQVKSVKVMRRCSMVEETIWGRLLVQISGGTSAAHCCSPTAQAHQASGLLPRVRPTPPT